MKNPLHPGIIVRDALIDNTDFSIAQAARMMGVNRSTLSRLINGKSGISNGMALKLSRFLGTSVEMWTNIQANYERDKGS